MNLVVKFDGLKNFRRKLVMAFGSDVKNINATELMNDVTRSSGSRLLAKVQKRTPVDTGQLRQNWTKSEVTKKGVVHTITIKNPVEYASYVEYGHRQQVGRYVPAIDKKLVKPWIEGQHFVEKSRIEMENEIPDIVEEKLIKKLVEITK